MQTQMKETGAMDLFERAEAAAQYIRAKIKQQPRVAVVLGSGLGAFADHLDDQVAIPYGEIPGFARSTVEGHAGKLIVGRTGETFVAAMQGRFHYYEGYSLADVTFPVRVFARLGIKSLLLTNAAGGINIDFKQGALMLIADHLNLIGDSPLRGANDDRFGARFPDLSEVYDRAYQQIAVEEARALNVELRHGVYAALSGPSYETPAEVRMLRILGADAVGMSTVPEATVARHSGMRVLGISCITNMAAGVLNQPIDHAEVMETGERVRVTFAELLSRVIPRLTA